MMRTAETNITPSLILAHHGRKRGSRNHNEDQEKEGLRLLRLAYRKEPPAPDEAPSFLKDPGTKPRGRIRSGQRSDAAMDTGQCRPAARDRF